MYFKSFVFIFFLLLFSVEVIQSTDPTAQDMFNEAIDINPNMNPSSLPNNNQNNATADRMMRNNDRMSSQHNNAFVRITEQPAAKVMRFRYKCECDGRSAGSIPGVNNTPENKTFPSIEIVGYKGRAVVVVSCVTKDAPFR